MKTFVTEYIASNEVGRVCTFGGHVEAETKEEAMAICEKIGHKFLGELIETIEAPEFAGLCDAIQEQRDKEWLTNSEQEKPDA